MGKPAKVRPELTGQKTPVPVRETEKPLWKIVPLEEIENAESMEFLRLEDYLIPDEQDQESSIPQNLRGWIRRELTTYHRSRQLRQKIDQRVVEVSRGINGGASPAVDQDDMKIAMRVETNTYHRSMQLREKIDRCSREVAEKVFEEKMGKTLVAPPKVDVDETKRIVREQIAEYHHSPLLRERIEKLVIPGREAELNGLFEEYRATEMLTGRLQERVEELAAETTAKEIQKAMTGVSQMVRKIVQECFDERARKQED